MTKPRTNPDRLLFGLLGSFADSSAQQSFWNKKFLDEHIDAFMDHYPTKDDQIPERLSEMFHFDRRGYIVGKSLQKAIIPYLDRAEEGSVNAVVNRGGILCGFFADSPEILWNVWSEM